MINFQFNKQTERKMRSWFANAATAHQKAIARAVNDTTKSLRTLASSEIRKTINLKKQAIDKRIHRFFINRFSGGIRIRLNRPISLANLTRKARQTKVGVSYQLYKGSATVIPHAFGPKISKLHNNVYVRQGAGRKPLSIKQYKDLAQDMHSQGIIAKLNRQANEIMRAKLKRSFEKMKFIK